jgi:hypothetical protein
MRNVLLAIVALVSAAGHCQPSDMDWLIVPGERVGPITAETSEASLHALFGAEHIRRTDVQLGEGTTTPGTVIFPDDAGRRMEIVWSDSARAVPKEIRLTGGSSMWRTAEGISLGSTLRDIERLNRFPFRLLGFAWDYAGTIVDCGRGRLTMLGCQQPRWLIVRLTPDRTAMDQPEYNQVLGDRVFSSGHPAMQSLNPRVYQMVVAIGAGRDL